MCSIIGYWGRGDAAPALVAGLRRMEYRGYDSVGVATWQDRAISVRKGVGRVDEVNAAEGLDRMPGRIGIGHTRWATHGAVSGANAHPHRSSAGGVAIAHNGIIDNHAELRRELEAGGAEFSSETDSEVIANLLQAHYAGSSAEDAMIRALARLRGRYSFVALFDDATVAAARAGPTLAVGIVPGGHVVCSDPAGFTGMTDECVFVDSGSFVTLYRGQLRAFAFDGTPARTEVTKVRGAEGGFSQSKGGYAHHTLKEICEQPAAVLRAAGGEGPMADALRAAGRVYLTGSGSSYHAALVAQHLMARYAKVRPEPVLASDFAHTPIAMDGGSLLLAISQSGESADVLEAARAARAAGARVAALVNAPGSALDREADVSLGLGCGREVGVCATKSFTSQLCRMYKVVERLSSGRLSLDLGALSSALAPLARGGGQLEAVAAEVAGAESMYVLGRGIHYPVACEGALKVKELAYIHAEGVPGGELKHGPLALMGEGVTVVLLNPGDSTYKDTQTSAAEIKARGARIVGVSDRPSPLYDAWVELPRLEEQAYPVAEIVPLQLIAYHAAVAREADPDYPRNLAKSVTVR